MEVFLIPALILLNGIFAMTEMALVSSRKFKLESEKNKDKTGAQAAVELSENPTRFLSTIQIGITLIGILLGLFSGQHITAYIEQILYPVIQITSVAHNVAVAFTVLCITYISIVFGELLPKKIGMTYPEPIAMLFARPMQVLTKITAPFVWLLTTSSDFLLKLAGIKTKISHVISEEEIKSIIKESTESGEIQHIEHEIVNRVFELGDRKIESLMTHRVDLITIDISDHIQDIRKKVGKDPHSGYPVTENNNADKIIGILLLKDIFEVSFDQSCSIKNYMKQPLFLIESTPAYKLLDLFREKKIHYAIITDEYGSTKGLATMDDVLDALVGDISQEHQVEYSITQRNTNSWLVDGQYSITEFIRKFELETPKNIHEFHTVGGFVIHESKGIPQTGAKVRFEHLTLEVIDMDGPRIDKILVSKN